MRETPTTTPAVARAPRPPHRPEGGERRACGRRRTCARRRRADAEVEGPRGLGRAAPPDRRGPRPGGRSHTARAVSPGTGVGTSPDGLRDRARPVIRSPPGRPARSTGGPANDRSPARTPPGPRVPMPTGTDGLGQRLRIGGDVAFVRGRQHPSHLVCENGPPSHVARAATSRGPHATARPHPPPRGARRQRSAAPAARRSARRTGRRRSSRTARRARAISAASRSSQGEAVGGPVSGSSAAVTAAR